MLEKSVSDKSSPEYQRITWDALKKSLNGLVNKVSQKNIEKIVPEIFCENLTRGRGPFCQSLMKSQAAAPNFSNIYASVVAAINSKLPEIGELLLKRLLTQWKKCYQRNQKNPPHFHLHIYCPSGQSIRLWCFYSASNPCPTPGQAHRRQC